MNSLWCLTRVLKREVKDEMCLGNEKDVTEEQQKMIMTAFKVFKVAEGELWGVYYSMEDKDGDSRPYRENKWEKATVREYLEIENSGFHCFMERSDAEMLANDQNEWCNSRVNYIVRKVKVRGLMKIGKPRGMGPVCFTMNGKAFTCREMLIMKE